MPFKNNMKERSPNASVPAKSPLARHTSGVITMNCAQHTMPSIVAYSIASTNPGKRQ